MPELEYNNVDTVVRDAILEHSSATIAAMRRGRVCHCCSFESLFGQFGLLYQINMVREDTDGNESTVATFQVQVHLGDTLEESYYVLSAAAHGVEDQIDSERIYPTGTNESRIRSMRNIVHRVRTAYGLHIDDDLYDQILPALEEIFD